MNLFLPKCHYSIRSIRQSLLFILFIVMAVIPQMVYAGGRDKAPLLLTDILADGLSLEEREHRHVKSHMENYRKHSVSIFSHLDEDRLVIFNYVLNEVKSRGMPLELAFIPLVESSYRPNASNRGTHVGLWQMGEATAKTFGVPVTRVFDGRYDIERSTQGALNYLEYLHNRFDGDWLLAIAAYNAGEGRVLRAMKRNEREGKKTDFWSLSLPRITQAYIPKVLALSRLAQEESRLKVPRRNVSKLVKIEVLKPTQLSAIVSEFSIELPSIEFYNPNYKRHKDHVRTIIVPEKYLK